MRVAERHRRRGKSTTRGESRRLKPVHSTGVRLPPSRSYQTTSTLARGSAGASPSRRSARRVCITKVGSGRKFTTEARRHGELQTFEIAVCRKDRKIGQDGQDQQDKFRFWDSIWASCGSCSSCQIFLVFRTRWCQSTESCPAPCLRASVPPCLRVSVPPCLRGESLPIF